MMDKPSEHFSKEWDRLHSDSVKWAGAAHKFGKAVFPMWVADMDFAVPKCITDALSQRIAHPIYGYPDHDLHVQESATRWMQQQYQWVPEPENFILVQGVLPGLFAAVRAFSRPGDGIIVMPPIYPPFFAAVEQNSRHLLSVPLLDGGNGRYHIDFARLEKVLDKARMLLLCSPHNPVGRVWSRDELQQVVSACRKHGVQIVVDEIHADLTHTWAVHTPLATVDPQCVLLASASKSFNIAGIGGAIAWVGEPEKKSVYLAELRRSKSLGMNTFAKVACQAAWDAGASWLLEMKVYLEKNALYLQSFLHQNIPAVHFRPPDFGYLAWLDLRSFGLSDAELHQRLLDAGLGLNAGLGFGQEGSGYVRLNYGTQCARLQHGLFLLQQALLS